MTEAVAVKRFGHCGAIAAWAALLAFETLAQVALKAGADDLAHMSMGSAWIATAISDPYVLAGVVGYLGAFVAWMVILDRMPLSLAFPLTSLVMLTVTLASYVIFGEIMTPWRIGGIGLIFTGILLMGFSDT